MNGPAALGGTTLEWRQAGAMSRRFEMFRGGARAGGLNFTKTFGTLAEGDVQGVAYTLKRSGFLHPLVTVRKQPYDEDIVRARLGLGSYGGVEFTDGRKYRFHRPSVWKNRWVFTDEQSEVLTIQMKAGLLKREGTVTVSGRGLGDPHHQLLALLGWYMVVLISEEGQAAAAASAGGASA